MKRLAAAVAILIPLTLAGCSAPVEGFVERKDAHPEQQKTLTIEFRHGEIPLKVTTPECYELEVLVAGSTESECIDQDAWIDVEVGDFYRSE